VTKSINPSRLSDQTSHKSLAVATQAVERDKESIKDLTECLDETTIQEVAEQHEAADQRKRKLTCVTLLWTLVISLVGGNGVLNLKWITHHYAVQQEDFTKQKLSKQAVSKQLRQRPWQYVRAVVEQVMELYAELFADQLGTTCAEWVRSILIVDETVMPLAQGLVEMYPSSRSTTERPRAESKVEVCLHPASCLPDVLAIREERDNRILSRFLRPEGEKALYLFDLGYWWYDLLSEIIRRGQHFVTRLRLDAAITVEHVTTGNPYWQGERLNLAALLPFKTIDLIVRLGSQKHKMDVSVRLVGLLTEDGWRFWATNLLDPALWPPIRIADLYRLRWQIEILFRVLKHVLNIHRFVASNDNGFRLQIYTALLFYLLTRILILKAAQQADLPLTAFSEVYALQVVSAALQRTTNLVRIGAPVDWLQLEQFLINLVINQARRSNPKRLSQLATFLKEAA
jgi:hypothetical protein